MYVNYEAAVKQMPFLKISSLVYTVKIQVSPFLNRK